MPEAFNFLMDVVISKNNFELEYEFPLTGFTFIHYD